MIAEETANGIRPLGTTFNENLNLQQRLLKQIRQLLKQTAA